MKSAGYSGTPLIKKLGMKDGQRAAFVNAPREFCAQKMPALRPPDRSGADYIHYFGSQRAELEKFLSKAKGGLVPNGMIWVSWPKKASKVPTDITEDVVRAIALKNGLVDVKVCAIDDVWSGLKLVIRLKDRPKK